MRWHFLDWVIKRLGLSSWANSHFLLDLSLTLKDPKTCHQAPCGQATRWGTEPCQQPHGWLERISCPSSPYVIEAPPVTLMISLQETLSQNLPGKQVRYPEIFNPQKLWNNTCCHLRLRGFGITCCVASDN